MIKIEGIKKILAHRYPFLLVDRVTVVDLANNVIECVKNVSANEPFFCGHFPGHAIMPGVLIVDAMAQSAGILGYHMAGLDSEEDHIYYFAGADGVRFKHPVVPGDQIILKAKYLKRKRNIWVFSCEAFVEEKIVCCARITCARTELKI
ncbi:MAG: 3-hydroxyacyl-ACP dehydratase FabZ [Candidatus Endonucleobacter bathymodioli]|uniref:3-hydroxyacyl-[acyl-carrier-protein] dehydratase FabZ n=1 Tax=Candidatus Endonucleibacter bathymodioli TaxID=539814 RepID=A0AA90NMD9_9GAMM|nr:3-hydroxyacyl-ACP dehydratase FabZ [Candidatus Endonucleobacter bathymodioli]